MGRKSTPPIQSALDQYLASRVGLAKNTLVNDRSVLQKFVNHVGIDRFGNPRAIGYLTAAMVERYFVETVMIDNASAASYMKTRQKVEHFLAYCQRHNWVQSDLMVDVGERKIMRLEKLQLTPLEMVTVLDHMRDPRDRAYIALASNSGLRRNEMSRLLVKDVLLDDQEIYIYRSKSYQDDRLAMTPTLMQEMRRWLTAYAQELSIMGARMHGRNVSPVELSRDMRLFPQRSLSRVQAVANNAYVERPLARLQPYKELQHPERIIHRALDQLGIMDQLGLGVHLFRRSAARAFFESMSQDGSYDQALRTVMTMLGHQNQHTTELYIGTDGDRRRRNEQLKSADFLPYQDVKIVKLRAVD